MSDKKQLRFSLISLLLLVALNLVAFNALLAGLPWLRLDLTEEGIYTISPATKRLLTALDEDLTIYGYFSSRTHPKLAPLKPQIADILEEYRTLSRDRVKVEIIDPGQDEVAEKEANDRFGVESTPFRLASKYESGIVNAYFALVVRYGDQYVRYGFQDLIEVEPTPDGDIEVRLRNLEYDLTRAIKKVVYGFRSTAELLSQIEDDVRLITIMTPDMLPDLLKDVPEAVRTAAQELQERAPDKFTFEEIDPTGDEQMQQELASRYGARPQTLGLFGDQNFYLYGFLQVGERMEQLGLVAENVSSANIREAIEDSLRRQAPGFLKTVGVVAPGNDLPPEVIQQLQMQGRQVPQPEFQTVKQFLGQDYQISDVSLGSPTGVPTDVDILLVLKPKDLDERAVYNLDQYLMRGGRVILCVGNYEANFGAGQLAVNPVTTGLDGWLAHHGIDVAKTMVLDDRNQSLPIPQTRQTILGNMRTWVFQPYPYLVEVREDGLVNREITARLGGVGIYWGSPVSVDAEKAGELEVINVLQSSALSWTSDDVSQVQYTDYQVPLEGTEPQLLAVALNGHFQSFFQDKGAPGAGIASADGEEPAAPTEVPLEESPETRLVVVGNSEFLSDFVARALARQQGGFFTENLAFVQNLIDWTNLDSDMVAIRARGGMARRISRMEKGTEITFEVINYIIPVLALLGLGAYRLWRRRNTLPVVARAVRPVTPTRASQEG